MLCQGGAQCAAQAQAATASWQEHVVTVAMPLLTGVYETILCGMVWVKMVQCDACSSEMMVATAPGGHWLACMDQAKDKPQAVAGDVGLL